MHLLDFILLLLLHSYRQRVTVDVIDSGAVLGCFWFPEEGERVDEAGGSLDGLDGYGVGWLVSGHRALVHVGSFGPPDEEDGRVKCSNGLCGILQCDTLKTVDQSVALTVI